MLGELIALCALAADPGISVEPLGPARPGGVLRVVVRCQPAPAAPLNLTAELLDGEIQLATAEATAVGGGESILVLTPASLGRGQVRVRATATWREEGQLSRTLSAEAPVTTPGAALSAVATIIGRLRASGSSEPLPWLWAEQVAELSADAASAAHVAEVSLRGARLSAWLDGARQAPVDGVQALRDPVDGSVQPYRLHLPDGAGPFPLLVLLPPATPELGKARWPATDAALMASARAAGVALLACYPAGDRAWNGAARRRIALTIAAAAAAAPLDLSRGACLGSAAGAGLPYALHALPGAVDAGWCRSILGAPLASEPGSGWADAPFAVVVGSAEHRAAAEANRALAESFRAAYARHAHAVVELLDDRVEPARLAGRHLILIGNPRSNRVLAGLRLDLPWRWDHRAVHGADGATSLRISMPPLVCRTRLPDGRIVIVLDGPAPPWGDGLPLAGP